MVYYDINSINDLYILFNHLRLYPLQSFKLHMFNLFKMIHGMYVKKQHLTPKGFMLCIAYINVLNKPINVNVLDLITRQHGCLPLFILPPTTVLSHYCLNPY